MSVTKKQSVSTQVIILLVSVVTLAFGLIGAVGYHFYHRELWQELQNELSVNADQASTSIGLAVWNLDHEQIRKIMESTMRNQVIYGVVVQYGNISIALARDSAWGIRKARSNEFAAGDLLVTKHEINFSGESIGNLTLYATPQFLNQKLKRSLQLLMGSIFFLDLLLVVSLYLLIWKQMLRPLKLIGAYAAAVSAGQHGKQEKSAPALAGEFGELSDSIQKMVVLLESQLGELKESNERFWNMVRRFPLPLVIYAPTSGQIVFLNQKFSEVFGYILSDIPHANDWFNLAYPDENYRQQVIDVWTRELETALLTNDLVRALSYKITCKNRETKVVDVGGVPSGEYMLVVFNDITERMQAEDEVRRYQDHLEDLVQQRTTELEAARDLAEAASRAKSVFLANMSHELRTPMNAILGFSQILMMTLENQAHKGYVQEIHTAGDHLLELINELLDMASIEAGKLAVSIEPVDVCAVLDASIHMVNSLILVNEIQLINQCEAGMYVQADNNRLRQVLVNLLSNAAKYNRIGGSISIETQLVEEGRIRILVKDTGLGIAPDDVQRLFNPFERVGAQFGAIEGTGIGLALSKKLMTLMHGAIGVESQPGQGSTFSIELSLAGNGNKTYEVTAEEIGNKFEEIGKLKILYVEDNPANLRLMEAIFKDQIGSTLVSATTGEQGLELAKKTLPDLILLDIQLPGMDGYAVLAALRAASETHDIPVIALSADAMPNHVERGRKAGFFAYLTKPLDITALQQSIKAALG